MTTSYIAVLRFPRNQRGRQPTKKAVVTAKGPNVEKTRNYASYYCRVRFPDVEEIKLSPISVEGFFEVIVG